MFLRLDEKKFASQQQLDTNEFILSLSHSHLGKPSLKKKMYFFSETRPLLGYFKKKCFFPLEMSNTCKKFQNPKIAGK